jgi:hypothetical protein
MNRLYDVKSSPTGIVHYRNRKTGAKGIWDTYRQTEKGLSRLPPPLFYVLLERLRKNLQKYGRRINAILISFAEGGKLCGFKFDIDKESASVVWKVNVGGQFAEYARFVALNGKWKEDYKKKRAGSKNMRSMKALMVSSAFLRFGADTNSSSKTQIHCFPKRVLPWDLGVK